MTHRTQKPRRSWNHGVRSTALTACAVAAWLASGSARAADIHVDSRNEGDEDGSTARPYRTVQGAVNQAAGGDRIKIASGSYAENVRVEGLALTFVGGYFGATSATYGQGSAGDFSSSDPVANPTELSGSSQAPVLHVAGSVSTTVESVRLGGGSHGIAVEGDPADSVGLTVRRCHIEGNGDPSGHGGGIWANAVLLVEDSIVRGNVADRGAGIATGGAWSRILRTRVEGNVAHGDHGGGIYAAGRVEIVGCIVRGNRVGEQIGYGWGGGIIVFNEGTKATIADSVLTGNYAPTKGSAIFGDEGAEMTIRNVLVANNECSEDGGAVYVDGANEQVGSHARLVNVTVTGHDCGDSNDGNALLLEQASTATVESCIFWGNGPTDVMVSASSTLTVRHTNSTETIPGTGNLSEDPLFANPSAGDYRLLSEAGRWDATAAQCVFDNQTSPCIDAGDPAGAFDREPDPNGSRVDMGAYGNSLAAGCAANGNGEFDAFGEPYGLDEWVGASGSGGAGGGSGGDAGSAGGTGSGSDAVACEGRYSACAHQPPRRSSGGVVPWVLALVLVRWGAGRRRNGAAVQTGVYR